MHFHFHDRDDLEGCTQDHRDQPVLNTLLATLDRMEFNLMSANQDALDALAARLAAAEARIEAKLAEAPAPAEALDFTAVNAAADKLDALAPAPATDVPAPVEVPPVAADPAPADVPVAEAPAADPSAPVDITVPATS